MNTQQTATEGTATKTAFPNLTKAIRKQFKNWETDFLNKLKLENDVNTILDKWYYRELLTDTTKKKDWSNDIKELKLYLIKRYEARQSAKLEKELTHLQTVFNADDLFSITISMDWKRSQMWGNNPQALAEVRTTNNYNRYESTRVGGCGYDKGSTAVAEAINQSNSLLKAMYTIKDKVKNVKLDNRDVFGYGSGYGLLPRFEGGVGVSCYNQICNSIGFEFKTKASGKTFDVYEISKLTKKSKKSNY
jgi:hypothetical protein